MWLQITQATFESPPEKGKGDITTSHGRGSGIIVIAQGMCSGTQALMNVSLSKYSSLAVAKQFLITSSSSADSSRWG